MAPLRFSARADTSPTANEPAGFGPTALSLNLTDPVRVTVSTSPPNLEVVVDNVSRLSPQVFDWENGSDHQLVVASLHVSGNVRYAFSNWTDGGPANRSIHVDGDVEVVAFYVTEYNVSFETSPPYLPVTIDEVDRPTPVSFWWPAGSAHLINSGKEVFPSGATRARGSLWSDGKPQTHTYYAEGPATLVAYYQIEHLLTLNTSFGQAGCNSYWCWYPEGANASFTLTAFPSESNGTRQDFRGWALQPGGGQVSGTVVMDGPKNLSAIWVTQYYLSVDARSDGLVSGGGWYDAGQVATVSVGAREVSAEGALWRFHEWSGDVRSTTSQIAVTMEGPKNVSATWQRVPTAAVDSSASSSLAVVVVALAIAGSAFVATPRGEWALAGLAAPLFTRLRRDEVRSQYHRGRLIQFIEDNPGANYSEIRRRLKLSNGGCAYHLGVLERSGEIRRVSQSATVRFYPSKYKFDAEALPPLAFVQRRVLEVLVARESAGFGEISRALAESGDPVGEGNLSHHLRELARGKELVDTRREGRKTIYSLPEERRKHIAERLQRERGVDAVMERATFAAVGVMGGVSEAGTGEAVGTSASSTAPTRVGETQPREAHPAPVPE